MQKIRNRTRSAFLYLAGLGSVAGASLARADVGYTEATNTMSQVTSTWNTTGNLWLGIFAFFAVTAIVGMLIGKIRGGRPR